MTTGNLYKNPSTKDCWVYCSSCSRCQDKGRYTKCNKCSGRYDPNGCIDTDNGDFCDCKNGILRWKTKNGKVLMSRFKANPFKGNVRYEKKSEDERDWDSYLKDMRNKMGDPNWNPVSIYED